MLQAHHRNRSNVFRHVVAVVLSYNNVPFDRLADAFAGVMVRDEPGTTGPVLDPRRVEQRYDLTSPARAGIPMVLDVASRTVRWLDVVQGVSGTHHAASAGTGSVSRSGGIRGVAGGSRTISVRSGATGRVVVVGTDGKAGAS
ncbi:hypothetical protein WN990_34945 [Kitasatospora purpeofusca]|uniref:hypothetical protein n=1 Tax=Kitasatospora purpeofusca TaxID=67352 RepID=UPI0030F212B3